MRERARVKVREKGKVKVTVDFPPSKARTAFRGCAASLPPLQPISKNLTTTTRAQLQTAVGIMFDNKDLAGSQNMKMFESTAKALDLGVVSVWLQLRLFG